MDLLAQILNTAIESDLESFVFELKRFSIAVTVILIPIFAYYVYKIRGIIREELLQRVEGELSPPPEPLSPYDTRWQGIKLRLQSTNQAEWKFAVIEADKLTDDVLKAAGYQGESMGERLISMEGQLNSLDKLWKAHKIRNMLVHDANFDLRRATALEAIDGFESSIRELGAID